MKNKEAYVEEAISNVANIFGKGIGEIKNLRPIQKGMTNNSYIFEIEGKEYVIRLPGLGSNQFVNRVEEKEVYDATKNLDFVEQVKYFDAETGVKISKYYADTRNADITEISDVKTCMKVARELHSRKIKVTHRFDIVDKISRYQTLCDTRDILYPSDFDEVTANIKKIIKLKNSMDVEEILCHCDFVFDNVLIDKDGKGVLIDWEYSGMADPILDIGMFALYANYDKNQVDQLLEEYLLHKPSKNEYIRLYTHIALGGYLWTLWTIYKEDFGYDYGEYGNDMYNYAKDYYQIIKDMDGIKNEK